MHRYERLIWNHLQIDERGSKVKKTYDIDVNDFFWMKNAGNPFPQVAEDVDAEINKYKSDVNQITNAQGVNSIEELDPK